MRKILILVFVLHVVVFANQKRLDELIDIALQNNPDIQVAKANIDAKDAGVGYAKADYLPQVSLDVEASQYDVKSSANEQSDGVVGGSASINQLLYDFGGVSNSIDASKSAYRASLNQYDYIVSDVVLSVKKAYYDILRKAQLVNVAKEAVKMDELQLEQASEYFKAGVRTKIDVTNAKLQLSNSKLDLLKAQFDLKSANNRLISILGIKLDKNFGVKKDSKDILELVQNMQFLNKDVDLLIESGLNNRSEIFLYKENINISKSNISKNRSEYYPKIYLSASYSERDSDILQYDTKEAKAGVYVKWDLFSGFKTESKIKESLANLKSSKADLKNIELKVTEEIISAYLDVKKSEDTTKMQLLSVDLATQNLSLARQRYKAGLSDMIELNDAKLGYTKSKSALVNAYYSYLISLANLDYVTGEK